MNQRKPFHELSTPRYILVCLFVAFVSAVFFSPLGEYVFSRRGEKNLAAPSTTKTQVTPKPLPSSGAIRHTEPKAEELRERYDSFSSRVAAVEESLRHRAADLGNQPVKPQITATIETAKTDLAEAKDALAHDDFERANLRMQRVADELKYLESL